MKKVLLASAVAAIALVVAVPAASAAPAAGGPYVYVAGHSYPNPSALPRGLSYGIGYHGAGSITGGPSGGLPNRN